MPCRQSWRMLLRSSITLAPCSNSRKLSTSVKVSTKQRSDRKGLIMATSATRAVFRAISFQINLLYSFFQFQQIMDFKSRNTAGKFQPKTIIAVALINHTGWGPEYFFCVFTKWFSHGEI